jgi:geranylgeranyl pyrophosphate synthase
MIDPVLSPSAVETLSGPLPMRPGSRPAFDPSVTPRFDPLESQQFEEALRAAVDSRPPLGPAMLDAVAGGNRLRPLMVREAFLAAAGHETTSSPDAWIAPAVAIELVHSASLAHDDLPAFDDERERRGRPALHVSAGVPAAILAGDALLAAAFAAIVRGTAAATVGPSVDLLARSVAVMCRGQQQDLVADDPDARRRANARKSGVLFATSGVLGVLAAGRRLDDPMVRRMIGLGMRLGTTYQAVDDVRDGDGDGRAAAVQFAALERRLATLPDLPRVRMLIDRFRSAAAAARAIRPVA